MKNVQAPVLAWHYTLGHSLLRILENGHLLPFDDEQTPAVECPVLWFSLNPTYEPSAAKRLVVNGVTQEPTLEAMRQFGNGLYRLGMAPKALHTGEVLRRQARISKERWANLVKMAKACGADVNDWYGAVDPVPVSACVIERSDVNGQWVKVG